MQPPALRPSLKFLMAPGLPVTCGLKSCAQHNAQMVAPHNSSVDITVPGSQLSGVVDASVSVVQGHWHYNTVVSPAWLGDCSIYVMAAVKLQCQCSDLIHVANTSMPGRHNKPKLCAASCSYQSHCSAVGCIKAWSAPLMRQ